MNNAESFGSQKTRLMGQIEMACGDYHGFSYEKDAIKFFQDCFNECDKLEEDCVVACKNEIEKKDIRRECWAVRNKLLNMMEEVSKSHSQWNDFACLRLEKVISD